MVKFFKKHWEVLSYLIFGVLTTLLNIVLYALFSKLFGYTAANSWGNVLDNILCILFAYATNRAFVFRSRTQGREMAKEFGAFVTCRLGTLVLDAVIMMVGGNLFAAQGAALVDTAMQGLLGAVAGWLGPDTTLYMANSFAGSHAAVADGSAAIAGDFAAGELAAEHIQRAVIKVNAGTAPDILRRALDGAAALTVTEDKPTAVFDLNLGCAVAGKGLAIQAQI